MAAPNTLISIVIVNFKVADYLKRTLLSLREADLYNRSEVIVVDNASHDDSRSLITAEFPEVTWVGLKNNIGFGKACNVGAKSGRGDLSPVSQPGHARFEKHPADMRGFLRALIRAPASWGPRSSTPTERCRLDAGGVFPRRWSRFTGSRA